MPSSSPLKFSRWWCRGCCWQPAAHNACSASYLTCGCQGREVGTSRCRPRAASLSSWRDWPWDLCRSPQCCPPHLSPSHRRQRCWWCKSWAGDIGVSEQPCSCRLALLHPLYHPGFSCCVGKFLHPYSAGSGKRSWWCLCSQLESAHCWIVWGRTLM